MLTFADIAKLLYSSSIRKKSDGNLQLKKNDCATTNEPDVTEAHNVPVLRLKKPSQESSKM